jgi:hypothetical protein
MNMDRRNFLRGIFGATGAAAALALTGGKAEAASLFDELMVAEGRSDLTSAATPAADLPAEEAAESQYYYVRPRRRAVRRRVVRRRCWYVRDRFGRLIRRCGFV